jgi:hypothetical protein
MRREPRCRQARLVAVGPRQGQGRPIERNDDGGWGDDGVHVVYGSLQRRRVEAGVALAALSQEHSGHNERGRPSKWRDFDVIFVGADGLSRGDREHNFFQYFSGGAAFRYPGVG